MNPRPRQMYPSTFSPLPPRTEAKRINHIRTINFIKLPFPLAAKAISELSVHGRRTTDNARGGWAVRTRAAEVKILIGGDLKRLLIFRWSRSVASSPSWTRRNYVSGAGARRDTSPWSKGHTFRAPDRSVIFWRACRCAAHRRYACSISDSYYGCSRGSGAKFNFNGVTLSTPLARTPFVRADTEFFRVFKVNDTTRPDADKTRPTGRIWFTAWYARRAAANGSGDG